MRLQHALTLAGAAAVSLCLSAAALAATNEAASSPATAEAGAYTPQASELARLDGWYTLDDGRVLVVERKLRRLYAGVGHAEVEIVPVAPDVYVARDHSLRIEFDRSGLATTVRLYSPAQG